MCTLYLVIFKDLKSLQEGFQPYILHLLALCEFITQVVQANISMSPLIWDVWIVSIFIHGIEKDSIRRQQ